MNLKASFNRLSFELLCYLPIYDSVKFLYLSISLLRKIEDQTKLMDNLTQQLFIIASQAMCVAVSILYLRVALHSDPRSWTTAGYFSVRIITLLQECLLQRAIIIYFIVELLLTSSLIKFYYQSTETFDGNVDVIERLR